jgi:flagellar biosynthesis protein FlhA
MAQANVISAPNAHAGRGVDIAFALGIVAILAIIFLPINPFLIDLGLALSIALSVLILMVALWIEQPLQFSAFPTVLLITTVLRLALNIASTRQILSHGGEGTDSAGYVIGGFSKLVMGGDFLIGVIVFIIIVTVNFLVITKGATRIAEVGARFALDAIPGKQMAIDADLSAGLMNEHEAQRRRRELEEESGFFGAMDGASKFVRGDAIAGLIITGVNMFGGVMVGVLRHGLSFRDAADAFVKLSVGDGLVTQIPALIVSLAAGLLVSKGASRGAANTTVLGQLGGQSRALYVSAGLMASLAFVPGLPLLPFVLLAAALTFFGYYVPKQAALARTADEAKAEQTQRQAAQSPRDSVQDALRTHDIELCLGKQLAASMISSQRELEHRVKKMREKFARQYGVIVPEIKVSDDLALPPKSYEVRVHGTMAARGEVRIGELLVVIGDGAAPAVPFDETVDPAFGMRALWVQEAYLDRLKRSGFAPVNNMSVLLTHVSEVILGSLPQLLSYKHFRFMIEKLEPEYRKLVDEISPAQISQSGIQATLKQLLSERVSIRNLSFILEAISEIVPHTRRPEQITEHVRFRLAQQICGDLVDEGVLKVLRLGSRWDLAFHQALKRDSKGEVNEFDLDPRLIEQFGKEASPTIRTHMDRGHRFVLVTHPDARPFVRMVTERLFPSLPVLSHVEISRGVTLNTLGTLS